MLDEIGKNESSKLFISIGIICNRVPTIKFELRRLFLNAEYISGSCLKILFYRGPVESCFGIDRILALLVHDESETSAIIMLSGKGREVAYMTVNNIQS